MVSVWNPSYATNAMEEHLAILLGRARDQEDPDEIYVWWGKVRSPNRQQPLEHPEDLQQLEAELSENPDREVHLYLTDYRSLYVGHVDRITVEDVSQADPAHVPDYYRHQSLRCDCWFKLLDIRRLAQDDTLAVIAELKRLRNVHYNDRPVSLYGGMVDLPLVVTREDETRFFDEESRDAIIGDRLWAEFDAEAGGAGAMLRELRENLFGNRSGRARSRYQGLPGHGRKSSATTGTTKASISSR